MICENALRLGFALITKHKVSVEEDDGLFLLKINGYTIFPYVGKRSAKYIANRIKKALTINKKKKRK